MTVIEDARKLKEYVDKRLTETDSKNISLHIPAMTPAMKRALEKYYKIDLMPFGYVRFEALPAPADGI